MIKTENINEISEEKDEQEQIQLLEDATKNITENNEEDIFMYSEKEMSNISLKVAQTDLEILEFVLNSSNEIKTVMLETEKEKKQHRENIISGLLFFIFLSIIAFVVFSVSENIDFSTEFIISFLTFIVAQIVSLLTIYVKFSTNEKYLEASNDIIKSLISYLKNSKDEK